MEVDKSGNKVEMTRWPQMITLMRYFEEVVLKLLRACDKCEVVTREVHDSKWQPECQRQQVGPLVG